MKETRKKIKRKLCLVASQGGHVQELWQIKALREKYSYYLVVPKTEWTESLQCDKIFVHDLDRRNFLTKLLSLVSMFIEQFVILIANPVDVVVTTGAAVAIPICLYAKILGKKVVYIESMARINSPSATGKFMYKIADLFVVQWKELLQYYPNAIYGGSIY